MKNFKLFLTFLTISTLTLASDSSANVEKKSPSIFATIANYTINPVNAAIQYADNGINNYVVAPIVTTVSTVCTTTANVVSTGCATTANVVSYFAGRPALSMIIAGALAGGYYQYVANNDTETTPEVKTSTKK